MKAEDTLDVINNALNGLASELAEGRSEQLRRYLGFMGRFHAYSVGNIMLIWSQRPDATRVAGFRTWKSMGRQVRRGEKGIGIVAPMRLRTQASESPAEPSAESKEDRVRFRVAYVFDIAQTDGDDVPEFARVQGDPGSMLERLRSFAASRGITIDTDDSLGSALGVSRGGRISLRPGLPPAEEFGTLAHELAHELLHRNTEARPDKTVRELEAESVAYAVTSAVGLTPGTSSRDYIHLYRGDEAKLLESLANIRDAAHPIVEFLFSTEDTLRTAA
ncbi:MAG: DUF1738 domain-containing protein [Phycisphaeraceae bacterium]|nr:hypothetical protein [Phycisphaerales bacterium]MCB9841676.1 DUF1738 domain-containing protein [Phycisphaeraceae bacterium]